ncbi:MAG: hypothetical protein K2X81_24165 [Candidatus Obscuribacterales bacterium]|nr:hypothetical protein [Candidatus Obscuribacterales bacterium]
MDTPSDSKPKTAPPAEETNPAAEKAAASGSTAPTEKKAEITADPLQALNRERWMEELMRPSELRSPSDLRALDSFAQKGFDKGFDKGFNKGFDKGFSGLSKGSIDLGADKISLDGDIYGRGGRTEKREYVPSEATLKILRTFETTDRNVTPAAVTNAATAMPPDVMAAELRKIFPRVNTNGDTKMDITELNRAVQDPSFKGQSAQALASIYSLARDNPSIAAGISQSGIDFIEKLKPLSEVGGALERVGRMGNALYLCKENDRVTKESIGRGIEKTTDAEVKSTLKEALKSFDQLQKLAESPGTGISSEGLAKLSGMPSAYEGQSMLKQLSTVSQRVAESQKYDERTLFGDFGGILGFGKNSGVVPEAVQQGLVHDCNLLAPLTSMAKVEPDQIRNMIKDNGKGMYTVTFPGAPKEPITVTAPTQTELGLYNGLTSYGTWPAVIEKAFGEYVRKHPEFVDLDKAPGTKDAPPAEALNRGGYWEGITLLTGHDAAVVDLGDRENSSKVISEQLAAGIENKSVMSIASKPKRFALIGDPIEGLHDFAIMGFDKNGPRGGTVTLRDPYGIKSAAKDATIKISVEELKNEFDWIAIEQKRKAR